MRLGAILIFSLLLGFPYAYGDSRSDQQAKIDNFAWIAADFVKVRFIIAFWVVGNVVVITCM